MQRLFRIATFGIVLLATIMAAGCTRVPRTRTLPPSIRDIAIPMFVNRSAEPGLEEGCTVATQEEFLADGRLNLTSVKGADAVVWVTLMDYDKLAQGQDEDDFARFYLLKVRARIDILENAPGRPAVGGSREIIVQSGWYDDKRRIGTTPEPEARRELYRAVARAVVQEVITGELLAPKG